MTGFWPALQPPGLRPGRDPSMVEARLLRRMLEAWPKGTLSPETTECPLCLRPILLWCQGPSMVEARLLRRMLEDWPKGTLSPETTECPLCLRPTLPRCRGPSTELTDRPLGPRISIPRRPGPSMELHGGLVEHPCGRARPA